MNPVTLSRFVPSLERTPSASGLLSPWTGIEKTTLAGRDGVGVGVGVTVAAAVAGTPAAPPVVCVHGLGASHRYLGPLARLLAPWAAVSALDLPGFGRSPGADRPLGIRELSLVLAGWMRATGRSGSVIVAHSTGCQVALDLATHAPDVLGPLVLIGPTMDPRRRRVPTLAWRLLAGVAAERPSLVPVLSWDYLRCGPRRYAGTLRSALADRPEHRLDRVDVPAVVVRGERDRLISAAWGRQLAAGLPHGSYREVPGSGHALVWSDPAPVAEAVRSLLPGDPAAALCEDDEHGSRPHGP